MTNDYMTATDGPDTRDGFFRQAYNVSYNGRVEEPSPETFLESSDTPIESDLLPDDEDEEETKNAYQPKKDSKTYEYDVAIIGSGPAGRAAAVRAQSLGGKVILFERDSLGGKWLNSGCIPAKVFLNRKPDNAGFENAYSDKNAFVSKLASSLARRMRTLRVRVEVGEAVLKSPHEVLCRGKIYKASSVILCGGAKPVVPQLPGLSHPGVITMDKIFELSEMPPRLLIYGGGTEGCEIASAFASFGCKVMIIETGSQLLPGWDSEIAESVEKMLMDKGVKVHTGVGVKEIVDRNGDPFVVTERGGVLCDKVLLATSQKPDLSVLDTLTTDIEVDDGLPVVNEYMETSIPGIYAAGDITGLGFQTHAACSMAETAASNAMGQQRVLELWSVPMVISLKPEAASVGLSEEETRERYGDEFVVGYITLIDNIKAMLDDASEGFVKVIAGKKHGEIYGVHIIGPNASEMIEGPAALMRMEATIHEVVDDIIHAHPTYAEAFTEACAEALKGLQ